MLANRSMPRSTVIPQVGYPDIGEAIDWLCVTFGFTLRVRMGDHRAQLNVGDGALVIMELPAGFEAQSALGEAFTDSVMIRVEDVDRHHEHALQRGARILRPPADYPYGERQYTVADHVGRRWTFSQSIADVDPRNWGGTPGTL